MARPEPRKLTSSLHGLSALTPMAQDAPPSLSAVPAMEEPASPATGPEVVPPAAPAPAKASVAKPVSETAKEPKKKQSFYQTTSEADQTRGAFRTTAHSEGYESLSDFIAKAVAEKVERLQNQYNGGRPFESFGANQIPKGRPLSS